MISICFVCTGNTCRSIMAERLLKKKLKENKISYVKVFSRGINACKENISENAKIILSEMHASDKDRKAIKLGKIDNNVLYITMTNAQKKIINSKKVISFNDLIGQDVLDPFGKDLNAYRNCADQIILGLNKLINKLSGGVK